MKPMSGVSVLALTSLSSLLSQSTKTKAWEATWESLDSRPKTQRGATSPSLASSSIGESSPSRPGDSVLVRAMRAAPNGSGGGGKDRIRNQNMRSFHSQDGA